MLGIKYKIDPKWWGYAGLAVGSLAAVLGIYSYYTNKQRNPNQNGDNEQQLYEKMSTQKYLNHIINELKKENNSTEFTPSLLKNIYRAQFKLSRNEFKELTIRNRVDRRKMINNIAKFQEIVLKYQEQKLNIHCKYLDAVLANFKMDKGMWMDEVDAFKSIGEEQSQEWEHLLVEEDTKEQQSLRNKNKPPIAPKLIKQILLYKIQLFQKIKQKQILNLESIEEPSDMMQVVDKYVVDKIYEKFKVEPEDIQYSVKEAEVLGGKFDEDMEKIVDLKQSIIFGDDEDEDDDFGGGLFDDEDDDDKIVAQLVQEKDPKVNEKENQDARKLAEDLFGDDEDYF